ncbi:Replication protein A C-terminal domain-containing protein [Candidatus Magnetomoraceae bacterium gMMP-1]
MPKKKEPGFDTMVKIFMRNYDIPTKTDVRRLIKRIDNIEKLIKSEKKISKPSMPDTIKKRKTLTKKSVKRASSTITAMDTVLDIIKKAEGPIGFPEIKLISGFKDKKLRNIIFRLNRLEKIKATERGVYILNIDNYEKV